MITVHPYLPYSHPPDSRRAAGQADLFRVEMRDMASIVIIILLPVLEKSENIEEGLG